MSWGEQRHDGETYGVLVEFEGPDAEKSREQLRNERDEWRNLFNQLISEFPEPIFAVDADRTLRYFNAAAEDAYNRAREEAIGTKGYQFFGTEGESEILAETVARTGETIWEQEFRKVPTPDGHLWNRSMAVHMEDLEGNTIGAVELTPIVTDIVKQRNGMQAAQETLSEEVRTAFADLREEAQSMAASSSQGSEIAVEQSETLDQIAGEIGTVSASVEEVASTAQQVEEESARAEERTVEGKAAAEEALDVMDSVERSAEAMESQVAELQSGIDEIDEIVDVIDDIANQTNMLALNASIEAARAGTAGEGFAVVADEVKSLAEESQANAGQIERMIDAIESTTAETVDSIRTTTEELSTAVDQTRTVTDNLDEIMDAVTRTSQGMADVADAMDDQATSTEEVASMIDEVAESADQLASEIETIAAANRSQSDLVGDIEQMVDELESSIASIGSGTQ